MDSKTGVKTHRMLEGEELAPKVAPRVLGLLTSKLKIFFRISVERGSCQVPLKLEIFTPASNFWRFDTPPPVPVSKGKST